MADPVGTTATIEGQGSMKKRTIGMVMAAVMMAAIAGALCGCESEDTDSDISSTRFNINQDLRSYSSVDNYTWDTTLEQATATIRVKDFTHGDATLRVFDANGRLLLTSYINTPDNTFYTGGNDYVVTRQTGSGASGAWRVEVGYDDFTGEIDLTLE
jgi:hypothetical protein